MTTDMYCCLSQQKCYGPKTTTSDSYLSVKILSDGWVKKSIFNIYIYIYR